MKASQYKAIRETGVGEFAIHPADVEMKLPWAIEHANKEASVRACPTGLVQATILKDDVPWKETFTLGCGDTEYQRERRNGVLVEMTLEALQAATKASMAQIRRQPRAKITMREGSKFVEMIVSKRSIMAPWNEYALVEAEREKSKVEEKERTARLEAAISAVGARDGRYVEVSGPYDEETGGYLPPKEYDYTFTAEYLRRGGQLGYLQGNVVLSLERAEEIAGLLGATGVAP